MRVGSISGNALQANVEAASKNAEPVASTSGNAGSAPPEITLDQFKEQLREVEKGLRSLPATAQVCQHGEVTGFHCTCTSAQCTHLTKDAVKIQAPSQWDCVIGDVVHWE